ncbi:MAG: hypothetical protein ACJ71S_04815 [Acidobacteriaceae bacterium]
MKHRYAKVTMLFAIAAIVSVCSARGASWPENGGQQLEGTWELQIGLQDCSSGSPVGAPFRSLLTFAQGGTMTETTANPMFFPAVRGPGHGAWIQTGHHTYKATSTAFITVNGALTRIQTIAQTIEIGRDDVFKTDAASVKFFQPDGTLVATGCAAAIGKRIEVTREP